jgi:hypothetical protein
MEFDSPALRTYSNPSSVGSMTNSEALTRLLDSLLSPKNAERLVTVFHDTAKIVHHRQKRMDKKQLKMKEISSALMLAESLHSGMFQFVADGSLKECFGDFNEEAALAYYQNNVMGEVQDSKGRLIIIDEDGISSLYKDASTGRHVVASENYEAVRGKRLPWIRHALINSTSIYVNEEQISGTFRRSFLYFSTVSIPLAGRAPQTEYHVVVVREKAGALRMVTAYGMFERDSLLKSIERCFPM